MSTKYHKVFDSIVKHIDIGEPPNSGNIQDELNYLEKIASILQNYFDKNSLNQVDITTADISTIVKSIAQTLQNINNIIEQKTTRNSNNQAKIREEKTKKKKTGIVKINQKHEFLNSLEKLYELLPNDNDAKPTLHSITQKIKIILNSPGFGITNTQVEKPDQTQYTLYTSSSSKHNRQT